jgi:hypothetical protein
MGPRTGLDEVEKNSCLYRDSNSDFSVVHPVASHYTKIRYLSETSLRLRHALSRQHKKSQVFVQGRLRYENLVHIICSE